MILTIDQLREAACELGLAEAADNIVGLALHSLRIHTKPVEDDELGIGASKFGGLPDLPSDFLWPHYINRSVGSKGRRESLGFLAQFNMQELAGCAPEGVLPKTGMLYFFAATWECAIGGEAGGHNSEWQVLYNNSEVFALKPSPPPLPLPKSLRDDICGSHAYPFETRQIWFCRELTLPDWGTGYTNGLALHDAEWDQYHELKGLLTFREFEREPVHRLMGHAQHKQGGSGPDEGGSTRLLLQLDSEDDCVRSIAWQAGGRGYFWIQSAAMEKHNFSDVSLSMECT